MAASPGRDATPTVAPPPMSARSTRASMQGSPLNTGAVRPEETTAAKLLDPQIGKCLHH